MINVNLGTATNESIQHEAIKNYLCNLLRKSVKDSGEYQCCNLGNKFYSRTNRAAPCFGVWKEYAFLENPDDDYDCIGNMGKPDNIMTWARDEQLGFTPEYDVTDKDLWTVINKRNLKVKFIADIAVQHKGDVHNVFEIIAYNPPSQDKLDFYYANGINCYVVNSFKLYDILLRKGELTEKDFVQNIKLG